MRLEQFLDPLRLVAQDSWRRLRYDTAHLSHCANRVTILATTLLLASRGRISDGWTPGLSGRFSDFHSLRKPDGFLARPV